MREYDNPLEYPPQIDRSAYYYITSHHITGEKEVSGQRKWSYVPGASGTCLYIPDTEISSSSYEEEDGDLKDPESAEFRAEAENLKPRVTWNSEARCFMFDRAISSLQQKIAQYRYWPLEVMLGSVISMKI